MEGSKRSRLFNYQALEQKDEVDERLEKCHGELTAFTANLRETELYSQLSEKVNRSAQDHEEITLALLYSILTDHSSAAKVYHTLTLVSRDSLVSIVGMIEQIVMENMARLNESVRVQLLWLTREMVKTGVSSVDRIVFALLKQMPAGSTSSTDIYIAETLLHIIIDNREWLESQSTLMTSVLYTYLSTIPSHAQPLLSTLRNQESELCVSLLRKKFMDCTQIGRDLVRLLQSVSRIPEFSELWRDLLQQPQKLSPHFVGVQQILSKRTSRRFIAGRILADVEIKLNFLLTKVKFGQHKIYQEWFQKKYLSTPESLQLIPEFIRYVCCVIHPPNEVLCSDVLPRWAVIGWLLSLCQSNAVVFSNAKLALFYDWLAYNTEVDSIMNIEPGILLMFHSLRSHPQITASLLDFLLRILPNFCPDIVDVINNGVKSALKDVLQKEVLLSLEPLFGSSHLDDELRANLRRTFPDFFQQVLNEAKGSEEDTGSGKRSESKIVLVTEEDTETGSEFNPILVTDQGSKFNVEEEDAEVTAAFSDNEDLALHVEEECVITSEDMSGPVSEEEVSNIWCKVEELPQQLKDKLLEFKNKSSVCVSLEEILNTLDHESSQGRITEIEMSVVVEALAECLSFDFSDGCVSNNSDSGNRVCFCLFRHCLGNAEAFHLLAALQCHLTRVGYFYLYYLYNVARIDDSKAKYKKFAAKCDVPNLKSCLLRDLEECVENEPPVFYELLPIVCNEFSSKLLGCTALINLVVAHIDPIQLCSVIHKLMTSVFHIFGKNKDNIQQLIIKSLQWDSFEQFCMWQLLNAEGPDCHLVIPALAQLNHDEHPEAIASALLFLKSESSVCFGVGSLLSLPTHQSVIIDAAASRWISNHPVRYAKFISQFINSLIQDDFNRSSLSVLQTVIENLERLLNTSLHSKEVFEASDMVLTQTLHKVYSSHPELSRRFKTLFKLVTGLVEGSRKRSSVVKDSETTVTPNPKRRRVTNIDDLTD